MARCYVFQDRASAQDCVDRINMRARIVYAAQGYQLDGDGAVIGKNSATGASAPEAARTTTWDVPRQRLDGEWVVRHCEAVPGATFVLTPTALPPLTVAAFVAQDIEASVTVEVEDASWWPAPPTVEVRG